MAKVKKFDAWTVLFLAVPALYALLLFYPLFESLQPSGVNALIIAFDRRPMVLVGTVFIMMVALCIRRISYIIRSSVATFQ